MSELDYEVTEAARDYAAVHDIDLTQVDGTGTDGKITIYDVRDVDPVLYSHRGAFYDCHQCPWNTVHEDQMKSHIRGKHS